MHVCVGCCLCVTVWVCILDEVPVEEASVSVLVVLAVEF
jgi:hypothetical protein